MEEGKVSLDSKVERYRNTAYASSTKSAYNCQVRKYMMFCKEQCYEPVPANSTQLCRYAAYLAKTLCPATVKQYLIS